MLFVSIKSRLSFVGSEIRIGSKENAGRVSIAISAGEVEHGPMRQREILMHKSLRASMYHKDLRPVAEADAMNHLALPKNSRCDSSEFMRAASTLQ